MMTLHPAENAAKFFCDKCDFKCSKKNNYDKHLTTLKHIKNCSGLQNIYEKMPKMPKKYTCECGNEYAHRQGLFVHKKKCNGNN